MDGWTDGWRAAQTHAAVISVSAAEKNPVEGKAEKYQRGIKIG